MGGNPVLYCFKNNIILGHALIIPLCKSWNPTYFGRQTIKADDFPEAILEYGGVERTEEIDQNTPKRTTYSELFQDIADSLRACGASGDIVADDFPDVIDSM